MAANPNIKQVYAMFNKQRITATYDEELDRYVIEAIAPALSSWPEPDHVYLMELFAEDLAGNVGKMDSTNPDYGEQLKIRVLEKSLPVATIVYPTEGSLLGKSTVKASLKLNDVGNSGINIETAVFKVNGSAVEGIEWSEAEGVYTATYDVVALSDGANTFTLQVTDNDGNVSVEATTHFVISTTAPELSVTAPAEGSFTNSTSVEVKGTTAPGTQYSEVATVTVDGEEVEVTEEGTFETTITLEEGSHTIVVVSTDNAGNSTTVRRTITVDLTAAVISDVKAEALIVDASGKIKVTFRVTEA